MPLWLPAAAFGSVAWLGLVSLRRRHAIGKRRAAGFCPACGYDLRATPEESGALLARCPECGAEGTVPEPRRL